MIAYMDSDFLKFTSILDRLVRQLSKYFPEASIPEWMTKGKTTLNQKDPQKRNHPLQL